MEPRPDIAARILASLAGLPAEEQTAAIHAIVGNLLKELPVEAICEMRGEIRNNLDPGQPIVSSTLDLIEGQLALREIAGSADWR